MSVTLDLMEYSSDALAQAAYVSGDAASATGGTITTDGNYWLTRSNHPTKYIRFRFVSESGGTNATIDAWYGGL